MKLREGSKIVCIEGAYSDELEKSMRMLGIVPMDWPVMGETYTLKDFSKHPGLITLEEIRWKDPGGKWYHPVFIKHHFISRTEYRAQKRKELDADRTMREGAGGEIDGSELPGSEEEVRQKSS